MIDLTLYFRPQCESESNDLGKCTSPYCSYNDNALITPHTFIIQNIQQQIEHVLTCISQKDPRLSLKSCSNSSNPMNDITDGKVYTSILYSLKNEH